MNDGADRPEVAISIRDLAGVGIAEHWSDLRGYIRKKIRNSHDAEDIAQSTYLRLATIKNKDLVIKKPSGFLRKVANWVLADFLEERTNESARTVLCADMEQMVESIFAEDSGRYMGEDLEARHHNIGLLEEVVRALEVISPTYAVPLMLVVSESLTHAEAAERLGLAEATVRTYVREARAQLNIQLFSKGARE